MKKILMSLIGIALACMCVFGCAAPKKPEQAELTLDDKKAIVEEHGLHYYLFDNPEETEEGFWALAEATCQITSYKDIQDRKVQLKDVLVEAAVVEAKETAKSSYAHEYTLTLAYDLGDGSYYAHKATIDINDATRRTHYFCYGADTIKALGRDDLIVLCCNPMKLNGVWDTYIYAIKKTGHQDGLANEIATIYNAQKETEKTSSPTETPERAIENYIWAKSLNYDNATVDTVTINEDSGTDAEGDYIALIYLTWNVKNTAETTEKMLQMYSDDLAASLAIDHPEVQEAAIFWNVPYLGSNTSKWSYERRGNGMYATDKVLGF